MEKKFKFLDLKVVNAPIIKELAEAAIGVIQSGWYINGENVKAFERELAQYCQTKHAIAVSNGLDALRLILKAYIELGVLNHGDEVIVPANTYIATILAISDNGLVPVFVEPDIVTMNLDLALVEQHITKHTRAIMLVHLYGTPCWSATVNELATKYKLKVIEDNAQAIGAQASANGLNGTYVTGSLGHAAGISFYPTKNLGALGDAGGVTTNSEEVSKLVRMLGNYGSEIKYQHIYKGINSRLDEIQAAVLCAKLPHLDRWNNCRRQIALNYISEIKNPLIKLPKVNPEAVPIWHIFAVTVENRDDFIQYLKKHGIYAQIHYPFAMHMHVAYRDLGYQKGAFPVAEYIAAHEVSLPIYYGMRQDDSQYMIDIINKYNK